MFQEETWQEVFEVKLAVPEESKNIDGLNEDFCNERASKRVLEKASA